MQNDKNIYNNHINNRYNSNINNKRLMTIYLIYDSCDLKFHSKNKINNIN